MGELALKRGAVTSRRFLTMSGNGTPVERGNDFSDNKIIEKE
jgi:hypothetical protein